MTDPLPHPDGGEARAIDQACDRFEAAWKASPPGPRPLLEDFLPPAGADWRVRCLLDLLGLERDYRLLRGESPRAEDYRQRLPDLHAEIEAWFAALPATCTANPEEGSPSVTLCDPPAGDVPAVRIPGYQILGQLGRGAMGVVYLARHVGLNRLVALKVILTVDCSEEVRGRFQTEAQVVARLNHPGVVQIHDAGVWRRDAGSPLPYLAMEHCPGGNLGAELAGELQPLPLAAALVEELARAMQAAHAAGVVHRDLKPANVLLDAQGKLKVADFGLARTDDSDTQLTRTGAFLGTPSYAAPEQARGEPHVGPAVDVYALGAILYECLTGRPPFKAATVLETLDQVRDQEPVPPRQLNPSVPRDLETVCLKCLRKEPAGRYQTAVELAEDLLSWREGRAIKARPVGAAEESWRWVRRHRALAGLYATLTLAVVALIAAGFWFSARLGAERERGNTAEAHADAEAARAEAIRDREQTQRFLALVGRAQTRIARPRPGWTWAALDELHEAAEFPAAAGRLAELRSDAAECLTALDARPVRPVGEKLSVFSVAWSPDGKWVALGQRALNVLVVNCVVTLIDPDDPERTRTFIFPQKRVWEGKRLAFDLANLVAFSPDGKRLVAGTRSGWLHCWDVERPGSPAFSVSVGPAWVKGLAFAADGRSVYACAGRIVSRWEPGQPKPAATYEAPHVGNGLDVHPTEGWVAVGGDSVLRLNAVTLQPLGPPLQMSGAPVVFTPDGRSLLAARDDQTSAWFLDGGGVAWQTPVPPDANGGRIESLALGAGGTLMLTASPFRGDRHACLWELPSARPVARLSIDGGARVAFAPGGRRFVVSDSRGAHLYEVNGLREQSWLRSDHVQPVRSFCLSGDGRSLASASRPRVSFTSELSAWSLDEGALLGRKSIPVESGDPVRQSLSVRGELIHAWEVRGARLRHWPLASERTKPGDEVGDVRQMRHDADGRLWAATADQVRLFDEAGKALAVFRHRGGLGLALTGKPGVWSVAPGRRWAAAGCRDGSLVVLRRDSDALVRIGGAMLSRAELNAVALSADENVVVAGSSSGELIVAGLPDGKKRSFVVGHAGEVAAVASACNGLFASGGRDGVVRLWRCESEALVELFTLRQARPVSDLVFHPDGVRLFVLLDGERGVRVYHLDRLGARLDDLGLGAGLNFQAVPLPPATRDDLPQPDAEPEEGKGLKVEWFASWFRRGLLKVTYERDVESGGPPEGCDSSRRTGWLRAPKAGRYLLTLHAEGVGRLWLDGVLLLDVRAGAARTEVALGEKPHRLRLEAAQLGDKQGLRLTWKPVGRRPETPVDAEWLSQAGK